MERLAERVKHLIESQFPGAVTDLDESPEGRIHGAVTWNGFDGMEHAERQQIVRGFLRTELGAEMVNVGVVLMYSPREVELMQAA